MNKKVKVFIVNLFAVMLFAVNGIMCLAASGEVQIGILPNQVWTSQSDHTDARTGKYSSVYARNHAVRPISGIDTFSKIQVRVTNGYGLVVSDIYTLNESASNNTSIPIKDGYLDIELVGFQFRGNSDSPAYATVSYDGR